MAGELYTINNGRLTLQVSDFGAEMQSLCLDGRELLWQGDPCCWKNRATSIFPYVGRMTNKNYTYKGKLYTMEIHGFVKNSTLSASRDGSGLTFSLVSSPVTLEQYPFHFCYKVSYRLEGMRVSVGYQVENTGEEPMFFGIGGHPGFNVPLAPGLRFEDYRLEFADACEPRRILFSQDEKLVCGSGPFPLAENRILPLVHSLFDDDAVVLENTPGIITLKCDQDPTELTVKSSGFRYLGLWHTPRSDAPFLCIEPWSSLPSRHGIVEELTGQENLVQLKPGDLYRGEWQIEVKCR